MTITISSLPFTLQTTNQPPPFPVGATISAATYIFQATDAQTVTPFNTFSNNSVAATIPQGVFAVGSQLTGIQYGPGILTFVAGAGVSLLPSGTLMAAGQYALMGVVQLFPDVWIGFGSFFPVGPIAWQASAGFAGSGGQGL